jgi:hypothetical protein
MPKWEVKEEGSRNVEIGSGNAGCGIHEGEHNYDDGRESGFDEVALCFSSEQAKKETR